MPAMMPERITISVDGDAADDEPEHAEAIVAPPAAASAGVEHPGEPPAEEAAGDGDLTVVTTILVRGNGAPSEGQFFLCTHMFK